jgi:N-acyl-D-aspartate/D-glutamate deacylase
MECELKLAGGQVIDGSGAAARKADVAVKDGKILDVGDLGQLQAKRVIDCTGKAITPGFIDIHSHSDWLLPGSDHGSLVEPFLRQGMTTIVAGNCGFSPAPITEVNQHSAHEASRLIIDDAIDLRWRAISEFLDALEESGVALNIAQLVGHGTVRSAVTGALNMAEPNADELAQMERLTKESLDAGCVGVSSGLGYPPGIFAGEDELTAFAGWAARDGKIFTSHLKAYSWISGVYQTDPTREAHNLTAIKEILNVGTRAHVRIQISHLIFVGRKTWPNCESALRLIETAREEGLDVAFDAFPYTAGNTTASVLFPPWILPRLEEVLEDPQQRANLRQFAETAFSSLGFDLRDIQIMNSNAPRFDQYNGLRVSEAAERASMDAFDLYCRLVAESKRMARVLIHTYSGDGAEEGPLRAVLRHPLCTIETDTFVTREGHQNPASYGTFPRCLSTYTKAGLFSLEEAVRKMTGAAAERLNWKDRGWVRPGCAADLVVIDPLRLRDTATFQRPSEFPEGIDHVFVNGRHVVNGDHYDPRARAGCVLRS